MTQRKSRSFQKGANIAEATRRRLSFEKWALYPKLQQGWIHSSKCVGQTIQGNNPYLMKLCMI